jgi:glycosyltransferase involved in cell wall biosynthesis
MIADDTTRQDPERTVETQPSEGARQLNVWLLNPYHAGSHAAWAEGYAGHSSHTVQILSMDGHFWKWRMQGAALELAAQARARLAAGQPPDLLLATSMVNLPAFLALLRAEPGFKSDIPVVLYMHENQLTYPPPPGSKRDLTYGMMQHLSMLAANRICFNSAYHLASWFGELPRLLKHFPDYTHLETITATRARAQVLPVGCDLCRLDRYRPGSVDGPEQDVEAPARSASNPVAGPLILWNQRWEYDKDPGTMLRALYSLSGEGVNFRVALAGENFRVLPTEFAEAKARLGPRLVHYGYVPDLASYAQLLWNADIVLSTAIHEFFGVSIIEALYCGCFPVLPRRLSYPELIPESLHDLCLYEDFDGLLVRLRAAIDRAPGILAPGGASQMAPPWSHPSLPDEQHLMELTPGRWTDKRLREAAASFDWQTQAPACDALLTRVFTKR